MTLLSLLWQENEYFPSHFFGITSCLQVYNHGQKSWDKFTFVALFQTRQTNSHARIHLHLVSPSPQHHTYNVGHVYTLFLQSFNIVWGWGGVWGGKATQFKTDNSAFLKLRFENKKINAITLVSQGIWSTIVGVRNVKIHPCETNTKPFLFETKVVFNWRPACISLKILNTFIEKVLYLF